MNKKLEKEIRRIFLESGKAYMFGNSIYSESELNKMIKEIANLKLSYKRERIIEILEIHLESKNEIKRIANQIIGDDNND